MLKRVFDFTLAIFGLLLAAPLFVLISAVVTLTSPGPIFYRGLRVGRNGQPFWILKFRSMVADADKIGGSSTADGDARITGIGRLMRKCKLDELPQLFNVIRGEMSFVGPRPEVREYVDQYTEEERLILTLRPGITDWASIWNSDEGAVLQGAPDPDQAYTELIQPTKLALQLLYVRQQSLWLDTKIIFHTVLKLVSSKWIPKEIREYGRPKTWREAHRAPGDTGMVRAA